MEDIKRNKKSNKKCWRCSTKGHIKKECKSYWNTIKSKEDLEELLNDINTFNTSIIDVNICPINKQHLTNNEGFYYCIMDYVGTDEKMVFHITKTYNYRNIRIYNDDETKFKNLVKLINTPHILSVILKYIPNFLKIDIFVKSSWKLKYSDYAFLHQFVTNKRCCELHYLHKNHIYDYINHITSNKIGCKDMKYIISNFM